jgi:uncharacterized membrane protein YedE/YeeE
MVMTEYLPAVYGGLMIGIAAVALLYLLGRIAGISGILWGAVSGEPDNAWRWLFLVGLVGGALLYHSATGTPYPAASGLGWPFVIAGGLLVGFGTRLGSGCTSGHGVCGIGRLSTRSIIATVTFMTTGILTVYLLRHVVGLV